MMMRQAAASIIWWHNCYFIRSLLLLLLWCCCHCDFFCTAGWIDLDTPFDKRTTQSLVDHCTYYLVSFLFLFKMMD
jgi:hypothetical protein